jgi:RNA polymerase sigma-70 factor, ECF subfamily
MHDHGGAGDGPFVAADSTSTGLLQSVQSHDADAWRRLVRLYGPLVYRWARQAGLQAADAADITQDVFQTVAACVGEFRRCQTGDSFRGWLRAITRNKIGDQFRRLQSNVLAKGGTAAMEQMHAVPALSEQASPSDKVCEDGLLSQGAMALVRSEFEDRTWQAFWKTAAEGRPTADVAQELGMTLQAVYKAKSRVLARLRQELNEG